MNATTLTAPVPADITGISTRPGLGRLVAVELRKVFNTRAGFWMQAATAALTVLVVVLSSIVGEPADHTFAAILDVGSKPAAVLLPITGILLVTTEWSQRTGMITFTLVPIRSRILGAKLIASLVLTVGTLLLAVGVVAAGVLVASPRIDGTWTDVTPLIGQTAIYLAVGTLTGVAFGMLFLGPTPATIALFAFPIAFTGLATLAFLADAAPWLDTRLALGVMPREVMSGTEWARAGTASAIWMLLPLLIGLWRITRQEVSV